MRVATWLPGIGSSSLGADTDADACAHAHAGSFARADRDRHPYAYGHTRTDAPAHRNYTAGRDKGIADPHANEHCSAESYAHACPNIDSDVNTLWDSDAWTGPSDSH